VPVNLPIIEILCRDEAAIDGIIRVILRHTFTPQQHRLAHLCGPADATCAPSRRRCR
jgi:hypothetical protein